ncbi:hypothetical protein [endosymbiont 'TC1' of Trimyema compressum]|uniref:hypothetical protein n=1 Tax=endosymbiont 'TC1' of Trimyema compressum TaxID=243899 RepID=UPI001392264A|nr:hypothetical protein [endosymbiont 'TC1' of Trimyema compressum]
MKFLAVQNVATYNVKGGAKAILTSQRDSTIYTVAAQTTMNVDGPGSEFKLIHNGGLYGAYFSDGTGVSTINITGGGLLDAYTNEGHRAGINFQSQKSAAINISGTGMLEDGTKIYIRVNFILE